MSRSSTPSPPSAFVTCSGTALALILITVRQPRSRHLTPKADWHKQRRDVKCSSICI
jgi:hypothetical protein